MKNRSVYALCAVAAGIAALALAGLLSAGAQPASVAAQPTADAGATMNIPF